MAAIAIPATAPWLGPLDLLVAGECAPAATVTVGADVVKLVDWAFDVVFGVGMPVFPFS